MPNLFEVVSNLLLSSHLTETRSQARYEFSRTNYQTSDSQTQALSRRRSTSHSTSVARISSKDHQPLEAHDDHAIAENASLPPLSSTATTTEPGRVLTLSQLLHPPHEPMPTRSSQPTNSGQHAQNDFEAMQTLCTALNVSIECYTHLCATSQSRSPNNC